MPAKRKAAAAPKSTGGVQKRVHVERNHPLEALARQEVKVSDLKPGDLYSWREVGVVQSVGFAGVEVETESGHIRVSPDLWKYAAAKVPSQTSHVEPCSRTACVLTMHAWKDLMWVKFRKKPKKGQTEGDVREMWCLMKGTPDTLEGRTKVVEVVNDNGKPKTQERLIDNRTVMELKCDGVHYLVK